MAVKTDDLSDTENVVSLKGLYISYLDNGMCVHVFYMEGLCICVSAFYMVVMCVCAHIYIHTTLQIPHHTSTNDDRV